MLKKKHILLCMAGAAAGAVSGLFGAGGGMILIPLLTLCANLDDSQIFPASVSIILPICLICLLFSASNTGLTPMDIIPYLVGSTLGGVAAGLWGRKIPTTWLHRTLGLLILWGGIRYLW